MRSEFVRIKLSSSFKRNVSIAVMRRYSAANEHNTEIFFSVTVTHIARHGKLSFQVCAVTRDTRHCSQGYTLPLALALYILERLTTALEALY